MDSDWSLAISSTVCSANSLEWIIDTGVIFHVCPERDWFSNFKNLDTGVALMGNDHLCHILGIGTIRIKIFDGIVRELKDVRYVPALKKNLISVSVLEDEGFRVAIENRVLKVLSGAMIVMKGVRQRRLYYLMGSTILKDAAIDTTSLWHKQLGHTGDMANKKSNISRGVMFGETSMTKSMSPKQVETTKFKENSQQVETKIYALSITTDDVPSTHRERVQSPDSEFVE